MGATRTKKPNQPAAQIVIVLFILFILYQIYQKEPRVFVYLALFAGIAFVLYKVMMPLVEKSVFRCSKCGKSMAESSFHIAFSGAKDMEGGPNYPPLIIKIWRCYACRNEFWELVQLVPKRLTQEEKDELAADTYLYEYTHQGDGYSRVKIELPKQISAYRYQSIYQGLAKAVRMQNQKNGFKKSGVTFKI